MGPAGDTREGDVPLSDSVLFFLGFGSLELSVAQAPPAFPAPGQGCVGHSCTDDLISLLHSRDVWQEGRDAL